MNYINLVSLLRERFVLRSFQQGHLEEIKYIKVITNNINQWDKNTVYLGNITQEGLPTCPIMVLSTDTPIPLPEGSNSSTVRHEDFWDVFNLANELIYESLNAEASLFQLSQGALSGQSIVSLINSAATLLGNALILVSTDSKVLAHSTNYEIMDPLWKDNVNKGHYSEEFRQLVRANKDISQWGKQDGETKIISLSKDVQKKLVARIIKDGHLVGSLIMIEHHSKISISHTKQLPLVGKILFDSFLDNAGSTDDPFYTNILYSLLDQSDTADTLELITMTKATFPEEMVVIVARFIRKMENRYLKRSISIELERIFPTGHPVQYKSYIAILVPSISVQQKEELKNLADKESISLGISWPFSDIFQFKRHFNQGVTCIKQAQHFGQNKDVFEYTDFSFYDLLYNYTGKLPLENYCHPELKKLKEYDRENNTEFYTTLRIYLENNKSLSATAKAMFVHRNSMVYRINRINQLLMLNLDDIKVVQSLMDSFRIDTFKSSIDIMQ